MRSRCEPPSVVIDPDWMYQSAHAIAAIIKQMMRTRISSPDMFVCLSVYVANSNKIAPAPRVTTREQIWSGTANHKRTKRGHFSFCPRKRLAMRPCWAHDSGPYEEEAAGA